METLIKPGRYRCAAGQEAHVLKTPPQVSEPDCLVGWVLVKETQKWVVMTWTLNGRLSPKALSQYDISSPWIDKPEWDWSTTPPWMNWLAMDESDSWFLFNGKPHIRLSTWGGASYTPVPRSHAPKWSGDWKDSLVGRHGVEKP